MNTTKNFKAPLYTQVRSLWKMLCFLYLPIVFLFVIVGLLSNVFDEFSLSIFLLDVVTVAGLPFYAGFVPQLEGIMWAASLTICIFTFVALKRYQSDPGRSGRFLLHAGLVTLLMLFDNVFVFHGDSAPKYLHINKIVVLSIYAIVIVYFIASNWAEILSSEYLLGLLALGLLGTSIFLDSLPLRAIHAPSALQQVRFFLEDGSKFAGIATWLTYLARLALRNIGNIRESTATNHLTTRDIKYTNKESKGI
jgi:hypothetical protein